MKRFSNAKNTQKYVVNASFIKIAKLSKNGNRYTYMNVKLKIKSNYNMLFKKEHHTFVAT